MKKQSGFTLVEIAIVLVIIGLLLGGALKGQELIDNARINRIKSDTDQISAAIYSYQDRFGSLPGDDSNAVANVGAAAGDVGDGDGTIEGGWSSASGETKLAWSHLRLAGFLTGTGDDNPVHAFGGQMGIDQSEHGLVGRLVCHGSIRGDMARAIDVKFDDGVPNTGTVRGHSSQTAYATASNYTVCFDI